MSTPGEIAALLDGAPVRLLGQAEGLVGNPGTELHGQLETGGSVDRASGVAKRLAANQHRIAGILTRGAGAEPCGRQYEHKQETENNFHQTPPKQSTLYYRV